LGQTQSPHAYDALIKLIDTPSWRDTIRASGLTGLASLGDKRALELGVKYQKAPNQAAVRGAALFVVVYTGKDDPRTFGIVTGALKEAYFTRNFTLMASAAEALIYLADERGVGVFQDLRRKAAFLPYLVEMFSDYEARLRERLAAGKSKS
jgi:HEAT repeat protein